MAPQSRRTGHTTTDRGQTSVDLLLAVGLFFTAIAIVTVQAPTLFGIHGVDATDNRVPADMVANTLEQHTLSSTTSTGLNQSKVRAFFTKPDSNVTAQFPLPDTIGMNVRLTHIENGTAPYPLRTAAFRDGTVNGNAYVQRGPAPSGPTTVVHQYTTLNNERVKITVTMWLKP